VHAPDACHLYVSKSFTLSRILKQLVNNFNCTFHIIELLLAYVTHLFLLREFLASLDFTAREKEREEVFFSKSIICENVVCCLFLSISRLGISNVSFVRYYGSDNTRRINYRLIVIIAFHARFPFKRKGLTELSIESP